MSYSKLFFGTAGMPYSTPLPATTTKGIQRVSELNLGGMELEFVHSVNLTEEKALEVRKFAIENNVNLTCHGSYYINLNSVDKQIIGASRSRILSAAKIANLAGAKSVTFHPAFYLKNSPKEVFDKVKLQLARVVAELKEKRNPILIRPETTGKATQFGSIDEVIQLSSELEQVLPCIDFSHLHARSNGKVNSYDEFREVLEKCEKGLGKEFLKNLHCHVSGIEYTAKGERKHLFLKESDFKYKELLQALKDMNCAGVVICESPNIEDDALLLKKTFEEL